MEDKKHFSGNTEKNSRKDGCSMRERDFMENPYDEDEMELFDEEYPVSSNTECTGLIPSAVRDEAKLHSYGQIYDIPLAKDEQESLKHEKKDKNASNSLNKQ